MTTRLIYPGRYCSLTTLNRILKGPKYQNAKFFIFLDENTYNNCLPLLISQVSALEQAEFMEVPVGEEAKCIEIASQLWSDLMESGADRNSLIVNLGGGCVSDIGGFVAAGFKRGIRYINIPTTLIGMVDAAIGGKTAVNLEGVKNQIGFFHLPEITCIEPRFIDTLPDKELRSGLCEMLKTLALANPEQYAQMIAEITMGHVPLSNDIIKECATIKDSVVRQDPTDLGIRKILNFGHTFGHAIEAHAATSVPLTHGEAVALGMWCAIYLSTKKLGLHSEVLAQYTDALKSLTKIPRYNLRDTERLLAYMRQDKKNADNLILCVLLQQIGAPVIDVPVDENEIRDTLLNLGKI